MAEVEARQNGGEPQSAHFIDVVSAGIQTIDTDRDTGLTQAYFALKLAVTPPIPDTAEAAATRAQSALNEHDALGELLFAVATKAEVENAITDPADDSLALDVGMKFGYRGTVFIVGGPVEYTSASETGSYIDTITGILAGVVDPPDLT
jgi:hypothetical protein